MRLVALLICGAWSIVVHQRAVGRSGRDGYVFHLHSGIRKGLYERRQVRLQQPFDVIAARLDLRGDAIGGLADVKPERAEFGWVQFDRHISLPLELAQSDLLYNLIYDPGVHFGLGSVDGSGESMPSQDP